MEHRPYYHDLEHHALLQKMSVMQLWKIQYVTHTLLMKSYVRSTLYNQAYAQCNVYVTKWTEENGCAFKG